MPVSDTSTCKYVSELDGESVILEGDGTSFVRAVLIVIDPLRVNLRALETRLRIIYLSLF